MEAVTLDAVLSEPTFPRSPEVRRPSSAVALGTDGGNNRSAVKARRRLELREDFAVVGVQNQHLLVRCSSDDKTRCCRRDTADDGKFRARQESTSHMTLRDQWQYVGQSVQIFSTPLLCKSSPKAVGPLIAAKRFDCPKWANWNRKQTFFWCRLYVTRASGRFSPCDPARKANGYISRSWKATCLQFQASVSAGKVCRGALR